jgi:hypothetical protein
MVTKMNMPTEDTQKMVERASSMLCKSSRRHKVKQEGRGEG